MKVSIILTMAVAIGLAGYTNAARNCVSQCGQFPSCRSGDFSCYARERAFRACWKRCAGVRRLGYALDSEGDDDVFVRRLSTKRDNRNRSSRKCKKAGEAFSRWSGHCEGTCDNPRPMCKAVVSPGCKCMRGYVRDKRTDKCIPREYCDYAKVDVSPVLYRL